MCKKNLHSGSAETWWHAIKNLTTASCKRPTLKMPAGWISTSGLWRKKWLDAKERCILDPGSNRNSVWQLVVQNYRCAWCMHAAIGSPRRWRLLDVGTYNQERVAAQSSWDFSMLEFHNEVPARTAEIHNKPWETQQELTPIWVHFSSFKPLEWLRPLWLCLLQKQAGLRIMFRGNYLFNHLCLTLITTETTFPFDSFLNTIFIGQQIRVHHFNELLVISLHLTLCRRLIADYFTHHWW